MPRKAKAKAATPARKPGRPTKLTPALAAKILKLIESGNYILTSAAACGISRRIYYDWINRGRAELDAIEKGADAQRDEELYADFAARVEVAAAQSEIAAVKDVRAQTERWQAAMTYLERRFPDRWGRRQAIEHSGPQGGAIPLRAIKADEAATMSTEALKAIAEGRALELTDGGAVHSADPSGSDRSPEHSDRES